MMPPGRGSALTLRPIHSAILFGSVRKLNTVSGRAAIVSVRSMASVVVACIVVSPLLVALGAVPQPFEAVVPHAFQEGPYFGQPFGAGPVKPPRSLPSLGHQPRLLQHTEVLLDGRPADDEASG